MEGLIRDLDGVVDTEVGYAADCNDKKAADHHQDYLEKNPGGYTCHYIRGE
jgi:peptide methionine sulfoxide reductase MsrA